MTTTNLLSIGITCCGILGIGLVWLWGWRRDVKRTEQPRDRMMPNAASTFTSQFQAIIDQNGGMTFAPRYQPPFRSPELPLLTTEHAQWPKPVEGGWIMTPEHLARYRARPPR